MKLAAILIPLFFSSLAAQQTQSKSSLRETIQQAVYAEEEEARGKALSELRRQGGKDYELLVPELFLYSQRATTTRDGMAMAYLIEALRIPDTAIVRGLVPMLETAEPEVLTGIKGVLSQFEHETAHRLPSFSAYRPFLEDPIKNGVEPPAGLMRYLFERHEGAALLFMAQLHRPPLEELREILWAEHTIADTLWKQRYGFLPRDQVEPQAMEQLDLMSRHPRWWARLYAAKVMGRASFRDSQATARLAQDRNALVREAIAEATRQRRVKSPR